MKSSFDLETRTRSILLKLPVCSHPVPPPWLPEEVTTVLNFILLFTFDVLTIVFITYAYFPKHFVLLGFECYKNSICSLQIARSALHFPDLSVLYLCV